MDEGQECACDSREFIKVPQRRSPTARGEPITTPGKADRLCAASRARRNSSRATMKHIFAGPMSALRANRTCRRGDVVNNPMYGPAVRCKRTFIELADVRSCINVSGL